MGTGASAPRKLPADHMFPIHAQASDIGVFLSYQLTFAAKNNHKYLTLKQAIILHC